jgi:hypothetical protein
LTFIACVVPIASIASAQDTQPDAGAPNATTTVAPTVTATQTPTPTQTQTPPQTPPPTQTQAQAQTHAPSEQEAFRLGRMIELEAERARARRYGSSTVQMVLGAGAMVSSGLIFTLDLSGADSGLQTMVDILAVTGMIAGGLTIVDGLISFFVETPMERLFDRYAPIAIDASLTPDDRLRRGEMMLESMANAERSQRITGGVSSLVLGILEAGLAVFFAADNDLWSPYDPNATANRAIFATSFGLLAATAVGDAIGKIVWERGPAEVAWEHWHASHEVVTVQTSKVRFTPYLGPTLGGAAAGFSLRF